MDSSKQTSESRAAGQHVPPTTAQPSGRELQTEKAPCHEQTLVDEMRALGWGRIEDVVIRDGIPRLTKDTKLWSRVRTRRGATAAKAPSNNRTLHEQHRKFFADCKAIGNGAMERIEFSDGLPIYWKPAQPRMAKRS